ncbi:hypothetical protein BC827DRAFT_1383665 [Russula dissimulans]|nr:hypothetical protein BC827DRAFT_1383665 [Russula dissimulans]
MREGPCYLEGCLESRARDNPLLRGWDTTSYGQLEVTTLTSADNLFTSGRAASDSDSPACWLGPCDNPTRDMASSHLSPESLGVSLEAGQQDAKLLREHVEQSLRDMAKSARAIRDVMLSARPPEDSRELALIEYEEKVAAIHALTRGVLDLQSRINLPERRGLVLPTTHSHPHSPGEERQTNREDGFEITSITARLSEDSVAFPSSETGREDDEDFQPLQSPPPFQLGAAPPVPLHLIPLFPQRSSPSNRRRVSIDPSVPRIDEAPATLHRRRSLPSSSGEPTSSSQSDFWPLHTRDHAARSPVISRTLAYAMGQMDHAEPVESTRPAISKEGGVDPNEEKGIEQDAESVRASQPPGVAPHFGTGQGLVDTGEKMRDVAWCQTDGEERQEEPQRMSTTEETKPQSEVKTLRKPDEVEDNAKGFSRRQEETEVEQLEDLTLSPQADPEERYLNLKKQEMELRRAKAEVQILEEALQERENDLWSRLETIRQRLEVIRQRRALMDQEEDDLRQKLLDAGTKSKQALAKPRSGTERVAARG